EQQPVVLTAESKLVQCTRCGTTFDIDLAEARSQAGAGKKLFIHCANPKCGFMLDLKELIPEEKSVPGPEPVVDRSQKPSCYAPGMYGACVSDLRSQDRQCDDCAWSG
ncbi:unnamed protein product, partial [marine sediment metagenome]